MNLLYFVFPTFVGMTIENIICDFISSTAMCEGFQVDAVSRFFYFHVDIEVRSFAFGAFAKRRDGFPAANLYLHVGGLI